MARPDKLKTGNIFRYTKKLRKLKKKERESDLIYIYRLHLLITIWDEEIFLQLTLYKFSSTQRIVS